MNLLLFVLIVIHGLIHLMGFAKAFGLGKMAELTQPISRPVGLLWLLASLALLASAGWLLLAPQSWWICGAPAVILSQVLILMSWRDAKFGTLANVIILVPLVAAALDALPSSSRKDVDGRDVPHQAEAVWHTPNGEVSYAQFRRVEIAYNLKRLP